MVAQTAPCRAYWWFCLTVGYAGRRLAKAAHRPRDRLGPPVLVRTDDPRYDRGAEALPGPLRTALGLQAVHPLDGGGSPARLWLADTGSGRLVVKVLCGRDGSVDGHDLATFELKPRQIRAVHRRLPGLSPRYVRVVGTWRG